jgi:hypothetical protein
MTPAAIGFRAHSGWAALVAVGGLRRAPVVIARRRIETADPSIPGSKQPYHRAEGWELKKAEEYLRRCAARSRLLARRALRAALAELWNAGHKPVGCGILLASGKAPRKLSTILASHALIHAAEGQLFREVLIHASRHSKLPVTEVKEREVFVRAAAELRRPVERLQRRLAEMGRAIGPPWTQDEKLAALVAWLALAGSVRR